MIEKNLFNLIEYNKEYLLNLQYLKINRTLYRLESLLNCKNENKESNKICNHRDGDIDIIFSKIPLKYNDATIKELILKNQTKKRILYKDLEKNILEEITRLKYMNFSYSMEKIQQMNEMLMSNLESFFQIKNETPIIWKIKTSNLMYYGLSNTVFYFTDEAYILNFSLIG